MLQVLGDESNNFDIPNETDNFELYVSNCRVDPIFIKKPEYLRVEYDMTLCDTKLKSLSLSIYKKTAKIEYTLKEGGMEQVDIDNETYNRID